FQRGDAEHLPLDDGSVDVIVSVEASHCYGNIARFLDESLRVLKPGGALLWTDFAPRERNVELASLVRARAFEGRRDDDITPEVLRAMERDRARRRALIDARAAKWLRPALYNFAAADEQCDTVMRFRSGAHVYFLRHLVRA